MNFLKYTVTFLVLFIILLYFFAGMQKTAFNFQNKDLAPTDGNLAYAFIMPHPPAIVPEVGGINTKRAAKTIAAAEYVAKQVNRVNPDTVILITPHSVIKKDKFTIYTGEKAEGNLKNFGAPDVKLSFDIDNEFIKNLETSLQKTSLSLYPLEPNTPLDHGSFVSLYFLDQAGFKGKIVAINYCGQPKEAHLEFGKIIRQTINSSDKKFVFIASGDLSHRQEGRGFDRAIIQAVKAGEYEDIVNMETDFVRNAWECGYNPMLVGLGVVGIKPLQNRVFSYEAPFGVGYMVGSL